MQAEAFLSQALEVETEVRASEMQIEAIRDRLTSIHTSVITGMPGSGQRYKDSFSDAVAALADEEAALSERILRLCKKRDAVRQVIERVENCDQRALLELRYLCYLKWPNVAETMAFQERQIYRLRKQAIAAAQAVLDNS